MQVNLPFNQIEWSEMMATGIAQIDTQHRYLIDTLRDANANLPGDRRGTLLPEVTRMLLNYAIMHFDTEEGLMQRYGYEAAFPDVARQHIAQHRAFSRHVVIVCDSLREGRPVAKLDLLQYLNNWLRDHIMGIDQLLGAFLRDAQERTGTPVKPL
ncbi:MAG TPA: bacteriohemerythrin [Rhodocyclaceae bacterium]|nr:bacteriohemerythrin [Rhodocyclaceae bacterium]